MDVCTFVACSLGGLHALGLTMQTLDMLRESSLRLQLLSMLRLQLSAPQFIFGFYGALHATIFSTVHDRLRITLTSNSYSYSQSEVQLLFCSQETEGHYGATIRSP